MLCIEYYYYFQKKLQEIKDMNGIQVVPFLFQFNECLDLQESNIDNNSIFRFILYPDELINENINFNFERIQDLDILKNISSCLYYRFLPSKEYIYRTSDTGSDNFLVLTQTDIDNLKDIYNSIINEQPYDESIIPHNWLKHTVYYWEFKFRQNQNIYSVEKHHSLGWSSYILENAIIYLSLYEQIYDLLTKNIEELP